MLRKVITIQDLTLCLDKMDASGKIEIYQVFSEIYFHIYLEKSCEKDILKRYHVISIIWILINIGSRFVSMFNDNSNDYKLSQ